MNTLTYLAKKFPLPFYVTDGKENYKIISLSKDGSCFCQKQKVLINGAFKPLFGGWIILPQECNQRKWKYFNVTERNYGAWKFFTPNDAFTPAQKFILESERQTLFTYNFSPEACEQIEMDI